MSSTAELVYSLSTGDDAALLLDMGPDDADFDPLGTFSPALDFLTDANPTANDPATSVYCFVCNSCTDHFGDHDDLVEAGQAIYALDGSVLTADLARGTR
jgi:hypothetical protein